MKEQAILREEMNYLFKIGNVEVSRNSNEQSPSIKLLVASL